MNGPPEYVRTIPQALAYWAEVTPEAPAIVAPGRAPLTYRQLHDAVTRFAAALRGLGIGRADGLALLLPEGPELALSLLGSMSAGIAVPLLWPPTGRDHQQILASPRLRAILTTAGVDLAEVEVAGDGAPRLPVFTFVAGSSRLIDDFTITGDAISAETPERWPDEQDVALILQSSGTTGTPKLVPVLHRGMISTCRTGMENRGITAADRCLGLARAAYSQGINALAIPLYAGATVVCLPGLDLAALPGWYDTIRPTYLSSTPAVLNVLAGRNEIRDALGRSPLRGILSSASALSDNERRHLESRLGAPIQNVYGMTEANAIAGERDKAFRRVPGSVGIPWCELRIVDEWGEDVAGCGIGEIVVRGARVFPGYLDDAAANEAAFLPGGWFRTGDLGQLDEAGYLHLRGRRGEVVNRGGEKIVPGEVDAVLQSHPAVAAAAVFAVPDPRLGEDLVAAVIFRPGMSATPRQLRAWMLDRLPPARVPRRIWKVERLPRTPTGKVQRGELAARYLEQS